jgi:hypothetical protein
MYNKFRRGSILDKGALSFYDKLEMKISILKQLGGIKSNKSLWLILIIIILIVASLPAYYYYNQYKKTQAILQNPTASVSQETQTLIDKVGRLMVLPSGETPTIATVSDVTKLTSQPFFANAKNGDKVLIFTQSKEAILYRESIDKIIQVAPVNLGAPAASASANLNSATPTPATFTVVIYNSTTTSGLAGVAGNKITAAIANAKIVTEADAKGNYAKTQVIDVSGNQSTVASKLANLLGGSVSSSIPSGETKPNAQILVILGADFAK